MFRSIFLLFVSSFFFNGSSAQCEDNRYRNFVFDSFNVTSDIQYGNNLDYQEISTDLFLDVYQPTGDIEVDRPLVIVVHGGSFIAGSKEGTDVVPLCQDLAKMGYVVASIQYRLGIPIVGDLNQNATSAVVRGIHDSKAAVRFFRKDVEESGNTYNINPDHIYMAGVSAGGFNALHVAYLDQESEIPTVVDQTQPGLGGGVDGESGNLGYSSEIAGVINIAGAIADPDLMEAGDVPVCNFHGTDDSTVPFGSDVLVFFGVFEIDTVHGSETVAAQADALGIENCFEIQEGQGHVPHVSNTLYYDTLLSISSNFLSYLVCPNVELDCEYRDVEIVSSVDEHYLVGISLWPVPVQDQLQVSGLETQTDYQVLDASGRIVSNGTIPAAQSQISTEDLSKGIYLLYLRNNEGSLIERFIK